MVLCSFPGCERPMRYGRLKLCHPHYKQRLKGIDLRPLGWRQREVRAGRRPLVQSADAATVLVPLTRGYMAAIDAQFATEVAKFSWHASYKRQRKRICVYARTEYRLPTGEVIRTSLHRMVWRLAGRPEARELDHRNLDGLDCRLSNLRPANSIENQRNR